MVTTRYAVAHSTSLGNGTVMLAGVIQGEVPDVGSIGTALRPGTGIRVEVLGIGVVDPNMVAPNARGLLVKLISGEMDELDGTTIEFATLEK